MFIAFVVLCYCYVNYPTDLLTLAVMLVWLILICVDFLNMWFIWLTVALVLFYVEILKSGPGSGRICHHKSGQIRLRPDSENWNPVHPYQWVISAVEGGTATYYILLLINFIHDREVNTSEHLYWHEYQYKWSIHGHSYKHKRL